VRPLINKHRDKPTPLHTSLWEKLTKPRRRRGRGRRRRRGRERRTTYSSTIWQD
jgi:hypothetical protein